MSFYNDALQQNNTEIQSNNTELQDILDTVNALPDAGASVEFGWFETTFYIYGSSSYKIPFVIGMTWREWIETPMNMTLLTPTGEALPMRANGNCVDIYYPMMGTYWTLSESGIVNEPVSLDDTIINEFMYTAYGSAVGGYD